MPHPLHVPQQEEGSIRHKERRDSSQSAQDLLSRFVQSAGAQGKKRHKEQSKIAELAPSKWFCGKNVNVDYILVNLIKYYIYKYMYGIHNRFSKDTKED